MASDVRRRMVASAARLLSRRGLDATSFPAVLADTDASRGSVYHHFPEGKDELVGAALDLTSERLLGALAALDGERADVLVARFLDLWRGVLVASDCDAGCAVAAVTVVADASPLAGRVAAIFRGWRTRLTQVLVGGGLSPAVAARFATTLLAACEGAVLLARAERDIELFDAVARQMRDEVRRLLAERAAR